MKINKNKKVVGIVDNAAKKARNAYARKWRAENKDKVKAANERYWLRRAEREMEQQKSKQKGEI